jgi:gamma-glutamylcyclotransferase (GGCT)/AIG2-like uncharacterized protein YtfP
MNTERITERCSSSRFISRAKVKGYKLTFNKRSKDKSGKANLVYTGDKSLVWGVIFDISENQKPLLDKAEGLGKGYNEYKLKVISDLEEEIECFCYIATEKKYLDNNLKPCVLLTVGNKKNGYLLEKRFRFNDILTTIN